MVAELRHYDKNTVVVYTDDSTLVDELKSWPGFRRAQPYEVWPTGDPGQARTVGLDLFFDKEREPALRKRVQAFRRAQGLPHAA